MDDDRIKQSCVAVAFLWLVSMIFTNGAWADESNTKVKFNLLSDEFPRAVLEFYRQSRIEVLYIWKESLNLIHTQPVSGEYTPREALDIMLRGTGLRYDFATDHSVTILQPPPSEELPAPKKPEDGLVIVGPLAHRDLELVTVTGSLIRAGVDVRVPIVEVTQKDLSFAPFPTVEDALYQLPMVSLDTPRADLDVNDNYNWGSGINLRGLGVGATLVLVNGRRQPLSGTKSDFVDVSNIPAAAVDRVEILPRGASAIYGSDAIAGVVNIILKDHFDGAQTQVRYGGAPGGQDYVVVSQLVGTHWTSGNVLLVYQYSDGSSLPAAARGYAASADKAPYGGGNYRSYFTDPANIVDPSTDLPVAGNINFENSLANVDLFPQATQHSIYGTGKGELGPVELFLEGRFTQRSTYEKSLPQTSTMALGPENPFNPYPGNSTLVDYSFSKVLGPTILSDATQNYVGTLGARIQLGNDWQATLAETYGRERLFSDEYNLPNVGVLDTALSSADAVTAFNPFGAMSRGLLSSLWIDVPTHATSGMENTSLIADGPLFNLPVGVVKLAAGLERREESLVESVGTHGIPNEAPIYGAYVRRVGSAFIELSVPVIGDPSNFRAPPRLELTLAGRYDDYADFGHASNPEFEIRWVPFGFLGLHASWGTSFRVPKLADLYDTSDNLSELMVFPDPRSPTGESLVLVRQGDNPNLRPETAKSWTTGFDLVPDPDPGFEFSLSYYSITYTGQIATPDSTDSVNILSQSDEWAAAITRSPTAAQIAAICTRNDYVGSVATCLTSSPAAILDLRLANLASTSTNGLDLNLRQRLTTVGGDLDFGFVGNYVFHFDQAAGDASPSFNILNTFSNPLKFRFRSTATWEQRRPEEPGFGATLAVNFTNAYRNPQSTLSPDIGSLTTLDLQLRYHSAETSLWLGGMDIALNAINVFNQSPPFADYLFGFDRANAQPLGRVLSLNVSKKW